MSYARMKEQEETTCVRAGAPKKRKFCDDSSTALDRIPFLRRVGPAEVRHGRADCDGGAMPCDDEVA